MINVRVYMATSEQLVTAATERRVPSPEAPERSDPRKAPAPQSLGIHVQLSADLSLPF